MGAQENPFRDPDSPDVKTVTASKQTPANGKTAAAPATSTDLMGPRFDAATMMLIETEFKDASVEERKRWYAELKEVPPEMVPRILKMRRLTQQAMQDQQVAEQAVAQKQAAPASSHAEVATKPADIAQARSNYPASENRLQAVAPWDSTPAETTTQPAQDTNPVSPGPDIGLASATASSNAGQPMRTAAYSEGAGQIDSSAGSVGSPPLTYETQLERLIATAEQRVAKLTPGELEEEQLDYAAQHAYLRMLYLMADRQERALEAIPHLPTAEQEFWQQMFWSMSSYFDSTGIPNPSDRATHTVSQLTEANARLRERANLELRNLAFCKKIDAFGIYERFERNEFRPGQPVLVYAEMRNFLSEPTSDGQYRTVLKSTIEIHRAGSQSGLVTRQDFAPTEDLCRNRRHDYFHSYMINIPERVTVGPHVLKLIVEDQLNRKVASYSINFTVN